MKFCHECDQHIRPCRCRVWWCLGWIHVSNRPDGSGSHFCELGNKDLIASLGDE